MVVCRIRIRNEKTQTILNVLKRNRIAAIINSSWGGLEKIEAASETIHFVNNIPYDWLLPKIYAVVHHGGSGTTHMALKYACPSLVIPHILDQFYWNNIIAKQKLGTERCIN